MTPRIRWIPNLALTNKKYLAIGDAAPFFSTFEYSASAMNKIEYLAIKATKRLQTVSNYQAAQLLHLFPYDVNAGLLLNTSFYKSYQLVGVVKDHAERTFFIKVYDRPPTKECQYLEEKRELLQRILPDKAATIRCQLNDNLLQSPYLSCDSRLGVSELKQVAKAMYETAISNGLYGQGIKSERIIEGIGERFKLLELLSEKQYESVLSHGDFNSRNVFSNRQKVVVTDYEAVGHYPLYYDFFTLVFAQYEFARSISKRNRVVEDISAQLSSVFSISERKSLEYTAIFLAVTYLRHLEDWRKGQNFRLKKRAIINLKRLLNTNIV